MAHWFLRTDSISTQIKNQGERPRWGQTDAYILVHKYVQFRHSFDMCLTDSQG